jgi:hypothetical protein
MTEYDLAKEQLAEVLHVATKAAARADWRAVIIYVEDAKLLARHMQQLQTPEAQNDPQAH